MRGTRQPSAGALAASPAGVHCGMLSETVPPRATGAGGPPRRGHETAAAIGPRQGQTRTSSHRRMTEHDAREVTTERRLGMDSLLLHAQAWWDAQRFDQPA